jgi:hypothetical protein
MATSSLLGKMEGDEAFESVSDKWEFGVLEGKKGTKNTLPNEPE